MNSLDQIIISSLFTLGFLVHCLFAASNAVRDKRVSSTWAWFCTVKLTLLIRYGMTLCLFLVYANNQALVNKVLGFLSFTESMSLPVTKVTSVIIGYFADSVLDLISKIPKLSILSREIPQYGMLDCDPAQP